MAMKSITSTNNKPYKYWPIASKRQTIAQTQRRFENHGTTVPFVGLDSDQMEPILSREFAFDPILTCQQSLLKYEFIDFWFFEPWKSRHARPRSRQEDSAIAFLEQLVEWDANYLRVDCVKPEFQCVVKRCTEQVEKNGVPFYKFNPCAVQQVCARLRVAFQHVVTVVTIVTVTIQHCGSQTRAVSFAHAAAGRMHREQPDCKRESWSGSGDLISAWSWNAEYLVFHLTSLLAIQGFSVQLRDSFVSNPVLILFESCFLTLILAIVFPGLILCVSMFFLHFQMLFSDVMCAFD